MAGGPCRHEAAVSGGDSGYSARFPRLSIFGMGYFFCSGYVPFATTTARRAPGPCFARIACGRGRPLAPARFARLIALAREADAGRTSPVCSVGLFFAPARGDRRSGPRMPLLPVPSYHNFSEVKLFPVIFLNCSNEAQLPLETVSQRKDRLRFLDVQETCAVERHPGLRMVKAEIRRQSPRDIVLSAQRGGRLVLALDTADLAFEREGQCARFRANAGGDIPAVRVGSLRRKMLIAGACIDRGAAVDDFADNAEAPGIEPRPAGRGIGAFRRPQGRSPVPGARRALAAGRWKVAPRSRSPSSSTAAPTTHGPKRPVYPALVSSSSPRKPSKASTALPAPRRRRVSSRTAPETLPPSTVPQ